jgi:hypothetical protein
MTMRPKVVFVPFELINHRWVKCDTLPRFKEDNEVVTYMTEHPNIHFTADKLPRHLYWGAYTDYDAIQEYLLGVGTPEWLAHQRN